LSTAGLDGGRSGIRGRFTGDVYSACEYDAFGACQSKQAYVAGVISRSRISVLFAVEGDVQLSRRARLSEVLYWAASAVSSAVLFFFVWARYHIFQRSNDYKGSYLSRIGTASGVICLLSVGFGSSGASSPQAVAALLLSFSSVTIFIAAIRAFGGSNPGIALAGIQSRRIVTSGPYRLVRHPVYFAYILNWLAFSVLCGTVIVAFVFFVMVYLYWRVAREEEGSILESGDAAAYREYSKDTPMLVPFFF